MIVMGTIEVKYNMFASLAGGGGQPAVRVFISNDTECKTVKDVLEAYERQGGKP